LFVIIKMFKRRISIRKGFTIFVLSVFWLIIWFYMVWGIGYFRQGFYDRFDIAPPEEDRDFFEVLLIRYIDSLNVSYVSNPLFDPKEINDEIEKLYGEYYAQLRLPYPNGWRRTKRTFAEPLMTRMGVAGYFNPFLNEIHINNYLLPVSYPYTLAHEKAHQLGITSESECNLFATIICTSSSHQLVRYSGYLKTVSYLLSNFRKISPEKYKEVVDRIDPRIIDDYKEVQEHWKKGINKRLAEMQNKVYDSYLKTNRQEGGILSYSEMTGLLVAWELRGN